MPFETFKVKMAFGLFVSCVLLSVSLRGLGEALLANFKVSVILQLNNNSEHVKIGIIRSTGDLSSSWMLLVS